ncbi:MAG: SAM-dependent methyltransferase [Paramuribaculum sp.]|nr:SAM-dependent methyltransferase [Paramuribaculum sp.]
MPASNICVASRIKWFLVENVRSARRFLKRCDPAIDIDILHFTVLDEHTDSSDVASMLEPLRQGHDMAVISEAGCPGVADPGALAVEQAHRLGARVVPLVGPSSILLALMASGFNGQSFSFLGYLPYAVAERDRTFKDMERDIRLRRRTQIFIETPYRNNKLIEELVRRLPGDLRLCVASDITGRRESISTLTLRQWKGRRYDYDKIPTIFLLYI